MQPNELFRRRFVYDDEEVDYEYKQTRTVTVRPNFNYIFVVTNKFSRWLQNSNNNDNTPIVLNTVTSFRTKTNV